MTNNITRRQAIKYFSSFAGAAAVTPALSSATMPLALSELPPITLDQLAFVQQYTLLESSKVRAISIYVPEIANSEWSDEVQQRAWPAIATNVLRILGRFLFQVGVNVVSSAASNALENWRNGLPDENQRTVRNAEQQMAQANYVDYSRTALHTNRPVSQASTIAYGVANRNQRDICAPVYHVRGTTIQRNHAMIEAPVAVGLDAAALSWGNKRSGVTRQAGLMPVSYVSGLMPSIDGGTGAQPYTVRTQAGLAAVSYRNTGTNRGQARTTSFKQEWDGSMTPIYDQTLDVNWA